MEYAADTEYSRLYRSIFPMSRVFCGDIVKGVKVKDLEPFICVWKYDDRLGHQFRVSPHNYTKKRMMEYFDKRSNSLVSKFSEITYVNENDEEKTLVGRFIFDVDKLGNWVCTFGELEIDSDSNNYYKINSEGEGTMVKSAR